MDARSIPMPSRGAIGVWAFELSALEPGDSVSDAERARAARYVKPLLARRYLASRTMLRAILGAWCGERPQDVAIDLTGYGQPYLARHPERYFSLTHSGEHALVACAFAPIGIDLESRDALRDDGALAAHVLSEDELACWRAERADARHARLIWAWVAKEAYLKARGVGLSIAPTRVESPPPAGGPIRSAGDEVRWEVRPLEVWPSHAGAVCSAGSMAPVEIRVFDGTHWHADGLRAGPPRP